MEMALSAATDTAGGDGQVASGRGKAVGGGVTGHVRSDWLGLHLSVEVGALKMLTEHLEE